MSDTRYRRVRITGSPVERAEQYGQLAREQIGHTRDGYEQAFLGKGISWTQATDIAHNFVPYIDAWRPDLLDEVKGIAAGSGVSFDDILTINCRTEILWSAARTQADHLAAGFFGECSSFALEPGATREHQTLVGQNWDWLDTLSQGVIVLEVDRPDLPNYVTVVEAGLLAKTSLTQAGIALALNTLVSSLDGGRVGVPYHFLIRDLVDAETASDALTTLASVMRASSGNYVVGSADGAVVNIETAPGDARNVFPISPINGAVVHTNHFQRDIREGFDLAPTHMADSYVRLGRMNDRVRDAEKPLSVEGMKQVLGDHTDAPSSICCHPDQRSSPDTQWATLAAVIMNPQQKVMHLAEGTPCTAEWSLLDFSGLLG